MTACLLTLATFSAILAHANDRPNAAEIAIKAAYLYKFGDFIAWPPQAFANNSSAFTIGVIGADSLADELQQTVTGRSIDGRRVTVKKLRADETIANVNVLFIARSQESRLSEILAGLKGRPVLTVTESEQGLALGSMINFVTVNGRLRFEAAPRAAALKNLVISARLLSAAYRVAEAS
jgi:hypothetical protein